MVLNVLNLGLVPYETALQLQRTLMELRKASRVENTLLLLEHPPVITLGRNAQVSNVLASPESLAQRGVELFDIDRGGDVTFHGPGQLVAYPIFDLRHRHAENQRTHRGLDLRAAQQTRGQDRGARRTHLARRHHPRLRAERGHRPGFLLAHRALWPYQQASHLDGARVAKEIDVGRSGDSRVAQLREGVPLADAVAGVARRPAGTGYRGSEG